jgi:glucose 1-dehydrogenase
LIENALSSRIALVTGGDSGIGAACARALAAAGADTALTYLDDADGAAKTADDIASMGRRALALCSDVRQKVAVEECFERVSAKLGVPDILVNSAGLNMSGVEVADMSLETWEKGGYFYNIPLMFMDGAAAVTGQGNGWRRP